MRPVRGTVEELVSRIREDAEPGSELDLWVPDSLTFAGEHVPQDVAMAIVGDAVLAAGLGPDGFTEETGGRLYHFKPWA